MIEPKPIVMKGYVIYNPKTGLFSRGGTGPYWSKNPKIWSAIGHVKNHINLVVVDMYQYDMYNRNKKVIKLRNVYKGCQALEVTITQPAFDIYQYARDFAEREISQRKHMADYKIVEEK